jgi:hypothetical protein
MNCDFCHEDFNCDDPFRTTRIYLCEGKTDTVELFYCSETCRIAEHVLTAVNKMFNDCICDNTEPDKDKMLPAIMEYIMMNCKCSEEQFHEGVEKLMGMYPRMDVNTFLKNC